MAFRGDDSSFFVSEAQAIDLLMNQLSEYLLNVTDNAFTRNLVYINSGYKNIGNSLLDLSINSMTRS